MSTVSALKNRMTATQQWISILMDGLNGKPHSLGKGAGAAFEKAMSKQGVVLLSVTKAAKSGLVLKRGAKPVVHRNFGAPVGWHHLYCQEQFAKKE